MVSLLEYIYARVRAYTFLVTYVPMHVLSHYVHCMCGTCVQYSVYVCTCIMYVCTCVRIGMHTYVWESVCIYVCIHVVHTPV